MSLAITDLMVAILVMPMGILTLVQGYFPLAPVYCLAWICLDVLFCTASIMHLCTISVDRYLSLRYPMSFGRNKTRKRVTLKIIFVWILSFALSLPLSLMYSQDYDSLLINGTCQIPNPTYRVIGSIVSFYIPLMVMLVTYWLTVKLLDKQHKNLGMPQSNGWGTNDRTLQGRKYTWRRFINYQSDPGERDTPSRATSVRHNPVTATQSLPSSETTTPRHQHFSSGASSDTDYTNLDTQDLWLPDIEPTPSTLSALHQFGKEMLKLSNGLQNVNLGSSDTSTSANITPIRQRRAEDAARSSPSFKDSTFPFRKRSVDCDPSSGGALARYSPQYRIRRSASLQDSSLRRSILKQKLPTSEEDPSKCTSNSTVRSDHLPRIVHAIRKRGVAANPSIKESTLLPDSEISSTIESDSKTATSEDELLLPSNCRCPYFGTKSTKGENRNWNERNNDVVIIYSEKVTPKTSLVRWEGQKRRSLSSHRSSFSSNNSCPTGTTTTTIAATTTTTTSTVSNGNRLRRSATLKQANSVSAEAAAREPATVTGRSVRYSDKVRGGADQPQQRVPSTRNSSLMIRNTSKHCRIIRSEQKATKVLGVVFFTFVILWAPFFVLNLIPAVCDSCEEQIPQAIFDLATWLGYASSMVNPIFYTIFNNVFRQAFKKVLLCKYRGGRRHRWKPVKH